MNISRRNLLKASAPLAGLSLAPLAKENAVAKNKKNLTICLNLSTIMGQNLGFIKELQVASKAGFRSVEIWVPTLEKYLNNGGSIAEAKKVIQDLGLTIQNTIGFAPWIVDEADVRAKGLEQLKKEMGWVRELGCKRIAAPPMGAQNNPNINLKAAGERYGKILEVGKQMEVIPQLEMWGHSKCLNRVADALFIAAEAGKEDAKLLLDVYHIYRGESSLESLHVVGENSLDIFHVNDYTTNIKPADIKDADRIYVGDGEAPIADIIHKLTPNNRPLVISLELFNKTYYAQDAQLVANTGFQKMKQLVDRM
ncbi:sugar phosphate isomerase/epimerase [Sandaracinomonas limnophila]|uniref:Sugar phosphate isomerase/epimerase n=1 Tax=Sandaracinomonas limnophila TaxID=1862386 RepID=A0A437PPN8_9BACT|nr:sugar phosphate isomerase/epimerase family protein [Sandaracinomonas limnophila]RVU24187.1 sugar phosphate isomerase/epimerase [Sandaracinomonas limnophila]